MSTASGQTIAAQVAKDEPTTPAVSSFLQHLALLLGWQPVQASDLVPPKLFGGPTGLQCRLRAIDEGDFVAVRPEVLLPITGFELIGREICSLLTIQSDALIELGWFIGLSSEGRLHLSSVGWFQKPEEAVIALDIGNAMGAAVLQAFLAYSVEKEARPPAN